MVAVGYTMTKPKIDFTRHGRVISLLSAAWETYAREFAHDGRNAKVFLYHIQELQKLVLAEDAPGASQKKNQAS